jgi:hypothetical protein
MAEALRNPQPEYWHPPASPEIKPMPEMASACGGCGSEFMVGAHFCHVCGRTRQAQANLRDSSWTRHFAFVRVLEFHHVQSWLGLSFGSLTAFFIGIGCIVGALAVGLVYTVQSVADSQAIQLWRIEWLLGAIAAFLAGILLKRPSGSDQQD